MLPAPHPHHVHAAQWFLLLGAMLCLGGCDAPGGAAGGSGANNNPNECEPIEGEKRPEVVIEEPDNSLMMAASDPTNWIVDTTDEDGEASDVLLEAIDVTEAGSDIPLDIGVPAPDGSGRSVFSMPGGTFSEGTLVIRILGTDPTGCTGYDDVVLCVDIDSESCP